jgi:hypothetical protein
MIPETLKKMLQEHKRVCQSKDAKAIAYSLNINGYAMHADDVPVVKEREWLLANMAAWNRNLGTYIEDIESVRLFIQKDFEIALGHRFSKGWCQAAMLELSLQEIGQYL